jgi:hypothetical protein
VIGIGLQNKMLLIFPVGALLLALVLVGPRKIFATKYFPMAIAIAVVLWLPYLWWQARNGRPQWEMSRAIAGGSSGTSDSPMMFVLLQFGLMGPLLVPLWAFGLWRLWCDTRRRAFAVAYAVLFVTFAVSGGKAYYLGGITVGIDRDHLTHYFADIRPAGPIDNGLGIANDEQGQPLFVCRAPRASWPELWPQVKHLG